VILVLRIGRLGDFLVALPALRRLRELYPQEHIALITAYSSSSRVLKIAQSYTSDDLPPWVKFAVPRYVDQVFVASGIRSISGWIDLRGRLLALGPIRAVYVLGYHGDNWISRWKKRLWLRSMGIWAPLFDHAKGALSRDGHLCSLQVEEPWTIAHAPGRPRVPMEFSDLVTVVPEKEPVDRAERIWRMLAGDSRQRTRVVFFAGATFEHKRWPEERFLLCARELIANANACILFVGAAGDRAIAMRVVDQLPSDRVGEVCGQTSLEELTSLLAGADLFLGNDGGVAHLAAAVGLPSVTLMSGVHKAGVWDPSGQNCRSMRVSQLPCIGCGGEFQCPHGHRRCILEITVESVLINCYQMLNERRLPRDERPATTRL